MGNVLRKAFIFILALFLLFSLTACATIRGIGRARETISRTSEIEAMATKVIESIVNEDTISLLSLFSSDARKNEQTIRSEIKNAFEFIDGNIVSYNYAGIYGEYESIDEGIIQCFNCYPTFTNVTTDDGSKYEIWFSFYQKWNENPEREGISKIFISDEKNTDNYIEIGIGYLEWE